MCGIVGIINRQCELEEINHKNSLLMELYESLFHLQHRGQDSVGIELFENEYKCHLIKKLGLIHNLKTEFHNFVNMQPLCGLGHIRYSTNNGINDHGEEYDKLSQIQPIYKKNHTNPYNIHLCHNGHMIIDNKLLEFCKCHNISTIYNSDSELLYNIFHYLLNLPEIPNLYECSTEMLLLYI
jgi:Glutamine phosphoribosylpyrophosphate amidotransferase